MVRTEGRGFWWRVAVDIPTSVRDMECWLSFRLVEPGGASRVVSRALACCRMDAGHTFGKMESRGC